MDLVQPQSETTLPYTIEGGRYVWRRKGFTSFFFQKPPEVVDGEMMCGFCKHEDTYQYDRYIPSWYENKTIVTCKKCGSTDLSGKINGVPTVIFVGSDFVINNSAMKAAGAPEHVIRKHRNTKSY